MTARAPRLAALTVVSLVAAATLARGSTEEGAALVPDSFALAVLGVVGATGGVAGLAWFAGRARAAYETLNELNTFDL